MFTFGITSRARGRYDKCNVSFAIYFFGTMEKNANWMLEKIEFWIERVEFGRNGFEKVRMTFIEQIEKKNGKIGKKRKKITS